MISIKVFIGKPDNPASGAWVQLPVSEEELASLPTRYGTQEGEYIISDSEVDGVELRINEPTRLEDLNEFAEWCDSEDPNPSVVAAIQDTIGWNSSFEDIIDKYNQGDFTVLDGETEYDLGQSYIDMVGGFDNINNIENYIDWDSFRRDLRYDCPEDEDEEEWLDSMIDEYQSDPEGMLGREGMERYFDYESFGSDLKNDGFAQYLGFWVQVF